MREVSLYPSLSIPPNQEPYVSICRQRGTLHPLRDTSLCSIVR